MDTVQTALPTCHTLWIGAELGPVGRACLASFAAAGHRVCLHSYDPVADVPEGVDTFDADGLIDRSEIVRHQETGSVSLFSNRYRYEILTTLGGLWIDCDVLCLKPIPAKPYVFGWEDEHRMNGAVLGLPSGSPMLEDLRAIFTTPAFTPPWASWKRRLRYRFYRLARPGWGLGHMPWGTAGPIAITHYARKHGVADQAEARDVFYPVPFSEASVLSDPAAEIRPYVTQSTRAIHLWNHGTAGRAPQPGSFITRIAEGTWREALSAP